MIRFHNQHKELKKCIKYFGGRRGMSNNLKGKEIVNPLHVIKACCVKTHFFLKKEQMGHLALEF